MKTNHPFLRFFALLVIIVFLWGCTPSVQRYSDHAPLFSVTEFFSGDLHAVGVVQNFSGEVTRRFEADIKGRWQGNHGVLDEHFVFDDGEEQWRCWQLKVDGNELVGKAGDVVGVAKGQVSGNTLSWRYTLRVPKDGGDTIDIDLDDWLYLVTENHLINRTAMTKWGLPVGEVTLAIHRTNPQSSEPTRSSCQIIM